MWFSGGGTKSVVHTDSVDNMNCVYDGDKFFVMVDPKKYAEKVRKLINIRFACTMMYIKLIFFFFFRVFDVH